MDYSGRDIPMRLDVKHQPLNFDIYLSQNIDIPKTSLDEEPYNFQLELEALQKVDQILKRKQEEIPEAKTDEQEELALEDIQEQPEGENSSPGQLMSFNEAIPPPSCPIEAPLTPIKSTYFGSNPSKPEPEPPVAGSLVNPRDFEEIHYNPFDHLALQTIDELRELDLVFQASYANQATTNQLQSTTTDSTANHNSSYKTA